MCGDPHELSQEFPEYVEKIQVLKAEDPHFDKITEDYASVNHQIHQIETRAEPASEDYEHQLRRQRLALIDEIVYRLRQ